MKVVKKPIIIQYRYADTVEVINSLEGPVTAHPGDAVITGVKGEQYPVQRFKFDEWYIITEEGKAYKKPVVVDAELMEEEFEVVVSWANNPIRGRRGDYRLTYGPGDFGIVAADIFAETYDIVKE